VNRVVVAAVVGLALTACGTTVPLTTQSSGLAGADGLGGGPSDAATAPSAGTTGVVSGPGTTGAVAPGGSSTGAVTSTGTSSTSGAGTTGAVRTGSGPVEVGILAAKDVGPATKALGVDGLSTGDGRAQSLAAVQLLNARGGLAGHKVVPIVVEQDATKDATTQYQAACSTFFDDHHVVAVFAWGLLPMVQACAARHGVPFLTSGNRSTSRSNFDRYPMTAVASQLVLDRMVGPWIASLQSGGWFVPASATEKVKIGLIFNEDNDFAGVPALVGAALRRAGLVLGLTQSMPGTDDTSKVSAATSAGSNAVLKFASQGVNRVLVVDKSGQALAYFGLAAASQGYYPKYGLTSLELPSALRTVLSARQLEGARGIGWLPSTDVPPSKQPPLSSNATQCVKAMTQAHQDMTLAATRLSALAMCDGVLLLGAAWKDTALAPSAFLPGLRSLGRTYGPVTALTDDFTAHRDGVSGVRPLAFDSACDCFAYTGPLRSVG
jgi:hypothetical protein